MKMLNKIRTKFPFSDEGYENNKPKSCLSKRSPLSLSQQSEWYFTTEAGILAKC